MGWIKDRLFGRRSPKLVQGWVCDSCNTDLSPEKTFYYLTTRDVTLSELYWERAFKTNLAVWTVFAPSQPQQLEMFRDFVKTMAGQSTPWSICEGCSEFFVFDRDQAGSLAVLRVAPPRTGPVDPSGCVLFAALGWERATGRWPEVVARPPALDTCDFCDKTIYEGELDGFVPEPAYHRNRAEGTMAEALRPARTKSGEVGWCTCMRCMSRHLALVDRARRGA